MKAKAKKKISTALEKIQQAEKEALLQKSQKRGARVIAIRSEHKNKPLHVTEAGMEVWAYDSTGAIVCGKENQSYGKVVENNPNYKAATSPFCLRRDVRFPHGRCSKHAPKAVGIDHHRFKGGRNLQGRDTRYAGLPPEMRIAVEKAMDDPNLTSLRRDIAAWDQRISEIAKIFGAVDPEIADRVFKSGKLINSIISKEYKPEILEEELIQHLELVKELQKKERNWREMQNAQLHRAKLAETENKRVTSEQTQIPVEKIAGLCQRIGKGISIGLRQAADKINDTYNSWPEEKRNNPLMLQELIIQYCEREIMEDLRPVISQFFPRPIEVQQAVARIAEERIANGEIEPDESTLSIAPTVLDR